MNYKFSKLSKKIVHAQNNLFNSNLYYEKINAELKSLKKNNVITKLKNFWNEYTKHISKSGYLDQFNSTIKLLLKKKEKIRILDLGGGYGDNYYQFRRFNESKLKRIDYYVVDQNKKLRCIGKKQFSNQQNIYFNERLPKERISLMLVVGTLQYICNFFKIIEQLNFESTSYLYFSRTIFINSKHNFFSIQKIQSKQKIEQSIKIHSLKKFIDLLGKYQFEVKFIRKNQFLNHYFKNTPSNYKVHYYDLLLKKKPASKDKTITRSDNK